MRLDSPLAAKQSEELLLKLRSEIAEATRERDSLDEALKERRRALSEVSQAVYARTGDYSDAIKAVKAMENDRDTTRRDFYREIDHRIEILDRFKDLDRAYSESKTRVENLSTQESALRKSISEATSSLTEARRSLVDAKTEESSIRESLCKESERLKYQEEAYNKRSAILDSREIALDRSLKELNRSKQRLKDYAESVGIKINYVEGEQNHA